MKSDTFTFKTSDGIQIFTYRWMPDEASAVKGTVQVAHGMAEHAARYERFAGSLTKAGYAVYANDHRGHGKTAGYRMQSVILPTNMAGKKLWRICTH